MPRTVSAALQAHLDHPFNKKTLAEWIEIAPTGKIIGMTTHDKDLIFDGGTGNGEVTHRAILGFVRSTFRESLEQHLSVMTVEGYFDAAGVTRADLIADSYKEADVWYGIVNWADLSHGVIKMLRGWVGRVTVWDHGYQMEVRSMLDRFNRQVGDTVSAANVGQFLPGMSQIIDP